MSVSIADQEIPPQEVDVPSHAFQEVGPGDVILGIGGIAVKHDEILDHHLDARGHLLPAYFDGGVAK